LGIFGYFGLLAATGLSLILIALHPIFVSVPALHRKAEARSPDLNVRPAANPLAGQDSDDARAFGDEPPIAVRLFADEAIAEAGISVAIGATFADDSLWLAITIEVAHLLDRTRRVGGRWVVASLPLLALEREAGGLESSGLVSG
jgi:hypothetical protein